ncbi:hypothetical protein FB451DRAFT_1190900 [Mycena latifolia]|nr:hypothetical protein FB451DRAFT_1190900 [Mycena latifolia]
MPPVPIGPQHLSANALHPPPFVPPSSMPIDVFKKCDKASKMLQGCRLANSEEQLELFIDTAQVLARYFSFRCYFVADPLLRQMTLTKYKETIAAYQYMYDWFLQFCNKFQQFWIRCQGSYPGLCQKLVNFTDELGHIRQRLKLEDANTKPRKAKKAAITPVSVDDSDDDPVLFPGSEDEAMEDAEPLIDLFQQVDDAIEIDGMSGDDSPKDTSSKSSSKHSAAESVKESTKGKGKGKDTSSFKKKDKQDHSETVRIPYLRNSRINTKSREYLKAMKVVAKTQPEEAEKVAGKTPLPSRKRRRASSFYEYIDSHESVQGMYSSTWPFYSADLRPAVALTPKQLPKLTPQHITNTIDRAHTLVTTKQPEVPDEAIIRQDRNVRSNLAFATHQIAYQLKMRDELLTEHLRLNEIMKERKLTTAELGPVFT